jgi:trehalose 6-phosphate synthase
VSRALRFAVLLVLGLAGLTFGASLLVQQRTRAWFENDLDRSARMAINGARPQLAAAWQAPAAELEAVLEELSQDKRILGACACSPDGDTVARSAAYPDHPSCAELLERLRRAPPEKQDRWSGVEELPEGDAYVSALPISAGESQLGYVLLAQDFSFVAPREAAAQGFLLAAFGVLAVLAALVTLFLSRMSWREWSSELRGVLRGGRQSKEFQPILSDVRELVDRLLDQEGRAWTAARLKETLHHQLRGEKVLVLANREPYVHQRAAVGGGVQVMHPASGLVTALEPILRACSGTWIAHGSGAADRETSDRHGRLKVPPKGEVHGAGEEGAESYVLRRVWLSEAEEQGYYSGFANEGLWPLCHIAHTRPAFRGEDWEHYRAVNEKFVRAVLEEKDSEDPIVLVQDYHFALAPELIRRALPRATVIAFWHIPWPNAELFGICPYAKELLEGLLGASILGFHTQFHCNNFLDAVDRLLEARIDRARSAVVYRGHETLVLPYSISVEWPMRQLVDVPEAKEARASVFKELALSAGVRLGVGVDRLDYTKGIEERLLAVERLFERHPEHLGRFTFVQLAAPSRTMIERYRQLGERIEELVHRIDARFARDGWHPIILRRAHHEPPDVFRYLRAADLCYVSSLHDGMNLVAKEFVAARSDARGVLILSQFTGAARELTEALIVNPYNLDEAADALAAALAMSPAEQAARLNSMRSYLAEFNIYRWAGRMLIDAARLRRKDRLYDRLESQPRATVAAR